MQSILRFIIKNRDGPSRIGELSIKDRKLITPNLLFIDDCRFKAPNFAESVITNKIIRDNRINLIISNKLDSTHSDDIKIINPFLYSNDLPKEIHLKSLEFNKNISQDCVIIPANIDIINNFFNEKKTIYVIYNASQIFNKPKKFVDFIVKLREKIGPEKIIYTPAISNPSNMSLLTYLGIDLFDISYGIRMARDNNLLFTDGPWNRKYLYEIPCNCPICNKYKEISKMSFNDILFHNYYTYFNEVQKIRNAIKNNNLRNLVENRIKVDPQLTSIMRNLDYHYYSYLEKKTPISKKNIILANSKESILRPEIRRYQIRIIERYIKPESVTILLLLPCSAKKPYSNSKSHKLFNRVISSIKNHNLIHEIIITSPIGLVPRELELIYPASKYDIPVTGIWDEDEKKMVRNLLQRYLQLNNYENIVIHLPENIYDIIKDIPKKHYFTCINDNPTSSESLNKLKSTLKDITKQTKPIKSQSRLLQNVKSIASYQFGKRIANQILKDTIIKGKTPELKIIKDKIQIGVITKMRGLISLTSKGAEIIKNNNKYWVKISDDFEVKGSILAPGILQADKEIRIGDEVIIFRKDRFCGIGKALMDGAEMEKSNYGEAIKIRHFKKNI
jgi:archaeosine synthase